MTVLSTTPPSTPPSTLSPTGAVPVLDERELAPLDAWWRACNYLTVAQIYLQDNPLLHRPLRPSDIKPRLLGHWGTSPGLGFVHAHAARLAARTAQELLFLTGPGHGGPALVAASWLDGTYSRLFPDVTQDAAGLERLVRQFSTPGGIPSHASATTPGSVHEGGELGYVLMHAFGTVMDNPDLLAVAVVGDGEAETAPLEGSWKGISFLDPVHDGAVLPVLHLNGAKISGPTVLARKPAAEVLALMRGHGYEPIEVSGDDLPGMHHRFAEALTRAWTRIREIQHDARAHGRPATRPVWPMIVLRSPKGWTGPLEVDGVRIEGTFRSHQVPLHQVRENPEHLRLLEEWLRSYRPGQLFDQDGRPSALVRAHTAASTPISASPHANAGVVRELELRPLSTYAVDVASPGTSRAESTRALGRMLRDLYLDNPTSFRLFCPDETASNRLDDVLAATDRATSERVEPDDVHLAHGGRLMEVLSEHSCHGWLEGYTLTGRHGLFATYEAFAMVSASQTIQHGKWLEEAEEVAWRKPVPSLNLLLTSTAWRNDHNGFSHQGPGLIQNVLTMRGPVARAYFPPDANTLLAVADHCWRTRSTVNLIVIDKQPQLQWLDLPAAQEHVRRGGGRWDFAGTDDGTRVPDVVLACAGDVVTMETVAAAEILRTALPELVVRVVNIVDLMALSAPGSHPHALDELTFRELFTDDAPVVFAFHGFPAAIHSVVHGRPRSDRFHVRGFVERGTTTTPHDMVVRNHVSRHDLVLAALEHARRTPPGATALRDAAEAFLLRHHDAIRSTLEDLPEITGWTLAPH